MAISQKQLAANRRNALKSTGPKDTSRSRLNALKHGLLSKEVLMAGEEKKVLEQLGRKLRLELTPQGELETVLVDRIISSMWRLKRAVRVETGYLQAEYEECKASDWGIGERNDSKTWSLVAMRQLGNSTTWLNLIRYESAIERQIYRALHELMRIQAARTGEKPVAPIALDVDMTKD